MRYEFIVEFKVLHVYEFMFSLYSDGIHFFARRSKVRYEATCGSRSMLMFFLYCDKKAKESDKYHALRCAVKR